MANTWFALTRGIRRGFDHFDDACAEHLHTEPGWGATEVFERSLAWMDAQGGAPTFTLVQVLDVHAPYDPGEGWRGRFGGDAVGAGPMLPVVTRRTLVARSLRRSQTAALGSEGATIDAVSGARMRALYDENLAEFDADLGAFLEQLRERPWFDDALIVITADHGESMEDARFVFDHFAPEEDVLRVPLLVRLPGGRGAGRRVDAPVELVDLYPTLVEFAGLDADDRGLDGRSLRPALLGRASDAPAPRPVFVHDGGLRSRAVVDGRYKLVEWPIAGLPPATLLSIDGAYERWAATAPELARAARAAGIEPDGMADLWRAYDDPLLEHPLAPNLVGSMVEFFGEERGVVHELYDLEADPSAVDDTAADEPEVVRRLAALLEASRGERRALRPSLAESVDGAELSDERLERLRELGYLGD